MRLLGNGILRAAFCAGLLWALVACDMAVPPRQLVATDWHRQDLAAHLARWHAVALAANDLFLGGFDRKWQPAPNQVGHLTLHSRLVYTMLAGYEYTGDQRYLDAATRGADFLLEKFHDQVHGGFFNQVKADGTVVNEGKNTYGHAFALLALSHVARVTKDPKYVQAALAAWQDIDRGLRDASGGFRPEAPRNFGPSESLRTQNPVMHMFEALLALVDATGNPAALAGAQSVGNFVLFKLLVGHPDGGASIPEWYDANWKPLPGKGDGGYVDIGHQFEWSHLLSSAERRGLSGVFGASGERMLKYALAVGYDDIDGGIYNRIYPDGSIDRGKYWWQQAEALRALLVAASISRRADLWRRYEQTLDLVKAELVDDVDGGWRLGTRKTCGAGPCGNEQPDPYHMVGMHLAALQVAKAGE